MLMLSFQDRFVILPALGLTCGVAFMAYRALKSSSEILLEKEKQRERLDQKLERLERKMEQKEQKREEERLEFEQQRKDWEEQRKDWEEQRKDWEKQRKDWEQKWKDYYTLENHFYALCGPRGRITLTAEPVIGVIGEELLRVRKHVEEIVFQTRSQPSLDNVNKDTLGVVYIRAPPRHGKSLCLDKLFREDSTVHVVEVSFNGAMGFEADYVANGDGKAPCWMLLKKMFESVFRFDGLVVNNLRGRYGDDCQEAMKHLRDSITSRKPSVNRVLLAIDELSNMTGMMKEDQHEAFTNFLSQIMELPSTSAARWGIVATGFTQEQRGRLMSSGILKEMLVISSIPGDTARPLLVAILMCYRSFNVPFPTFLWECCKTSPGLLGELLEKALQRPHVSFQSFADSLKWSLSITVDAVYFQETVALVMQYFRAKFTGERITGDFRELLLNRCLALERPSCKTEEVSIVPFVAGVIVLHLTQRPELLDAAKSSTPEITYLCNMMHRGAFARIRSTSQDTSSSESGGTPTEVFVENSLLLRGHFVKTKQPLTDWFKPQWSDPHSGIPPLYFFKPTTQFPECTVMFVFGKEALENLLTPTLYDLFPIGCEDELDFVKQRDQCPSKPNREDLVACVKDWGKKREVSKQGPKTLTFGAEMATGPHEVFCLGAEVRPYEGSMQRFPCVSGKEAKGEIDTLVGTLLQHPHVTFVFRPAEDTNEVCDVVCATNHQTDDGRVMLEFVLVELKDRRQTRANEIATKLFGVYFTCTKQTKATLGEVLWTYVSKKVMESGKVQSVTLRIALVIAGRCENVYVLRGGGSETDCAADKKTK